MALVISILKEVGKALLLSLLTREFITELVIYFLEFLAKKTDNEVDDELVSRVKKALEKPENKDTEK